ncbi:MAG: hypothetical protein ABIT71_00165 [Vicinamibacteraceae bacterium]
MSVRSTVAAWLLCATVSSTFGSSALAQGSDPLPIAGRRLVQNYTEAVDPSFTRLGATWPAIGVPPALPCRVLAHAHLRPLLDELWSRSTTFRLQCRRLAGARAVVLLQGASAGETVWDAESRIGLLDDGRVAARVRVRAGRESVEVIAHELEHVLERIDGVHLALDALRRGSGTTLADGAYETRRATEAGRQAAKEVRRAAAQ